MNEQAKAWIVTSSDEESSRVVFDEKRSRARAWAAGEFDDSVVDVQIRRAKEFDQYAPGPVPLAALLEAGWWYPCYGCQRQIYNDEPGYIIETIGKVDEFDSSPEAIFCSTACQAEYRQRRKEAIKQRKRIQAIIAPEAAGGGEGGG